METEEMTVQVLQMLQWWVAVCFDQEGIELAPLFLFFAYFLSMSTVFVSNLL